MRVGRRLRPDAGVFDVDGDGDNDVLVFGANGAVVMHENLGDCSAWRTAHADQRTQGLARHALKPSAGGVVDIDGDDEVRATRPPCSPSRATLTSQHRSPHARSRARLLLHLVSLVPLHLAA